MCCSSAGRRLGKRLQNAASLRHRMVGVGEVRLETKGSCNGWTGLSARSLNARRRWPGSANRVSCGAVSSPHSNNVHCTFSTSLGQRIRHSCCTSAACTRCGWLAGSTNTRSADCCSPVTKETTMRRRRTPSNAAARSISRGRSEAMTASTTGCNVPEGGSNTTAAGGGAWVTAACTGRSSRPCAQRCACLPPGAKTLPDCRRGQFGKLAQGADAQPVQLLQMGVRQRQQCDRQRPQETGLVTLVHQAHAAGRHLHGGGTGRELARIPPQRRLQVLHPCRCAAAAPGQQPAAVRQSAVLATLCKST